MHPFYPKTRDALYDMEADPWEMDNRIDDPEQADRVSRMRQQLAESMRHCVAPSFFEIGQETYVNGEYQG